MGFLAVGGGAALVAVGVYLLVGDVAFPGLASVGLHLSATPQADASGKPKVRLPPDLALTECEVIGSESVLRAVVEPPPLGAGWVQKLQPGELRPTAEAMQTLRERMDVRADAAGKRIEIRVFGQEPAEAAGLANAVAEAYRAFRREHRWPPRQSARDFLREQLTQAERQVAQAQADLDRFHPAPEGAARPGGTSSAQTLESLRRATQARLETRAALAGQETLLAKLKGLSHEDLIEGLPLLVRDQLFEDLARSAAAADQKLSEARRSYGADHPETQKAKAALEAQRNKLDARGKDLMAALEVKVSGLQEILRKQTADLDRLQAEDLARGGINAPYRELTRRIEDAQRMREILAAKLASAPKETNQLGYLEVDIAGRALPAAKRVACHPLLGMSLTGLGLALGFAGLLGLTPPQGAGRTRGS